MKLKASSSNSLRIIRHKAAGLLYFPVRSMLVALVPDKDSLVCSRSCCLILQDLQLRLLPVRVFMIALRQALLSSAPPILLSAFTAILKTAFPCQN